MWYSILIKTPVIIPAYNEELCLAATLESLPNDLVEPIVAVNGSADNSAALAREYGCLVHDIPEQGKFPAIQFSLARLGDRALEPVLILDADTRPLLPRRWHRGMLKHLTKEEPNVPEIVGGPIWFTEGDIVNASLRSMTRLAKAVKTRTSEDIGKVSQCGPNMGIHLKTEPALQDSLSLEHFWPSEDRALIGTVLSHNGRLTQPIHPSMLTLTRYSSSFLPLSVVKKIGRNEARKKMFEDYAQRGAPGSKPFEIN